MFILNMLTELRRWRLELVIYFLNFCEFVIKNRIFLTKILKYPNVNDICLAKYLTILIEKQRIF